MLVVNLIDKDRIRSNEGFEDGRAVWRARLFLFVGFVFMSCGLVGSIVRTLGLFSIKSYTYSFIDSLDSQVRHARLSRTIHILRLRQRSTERGYHALHHHSLGCTEYQRRVRVQLDFVMYYLVPIIIFTFAPTV
jgi:hypothetical protein